MDCRAKKKITSGQWWKQGDHVRDYSKIQVAGGSGINSVLTVEVVGF